MKCANICDVCTGSRGSGPVLPQTRCKTPSTEVTSSDLRVIGRIPEVSPMSTTSKSNGRNWVSLIPYGLNEQHPNNYKDIVDSMWENRDNLGYAWKILQDGCC